MGYTLEVRAGSVDEVVGELRSPTLSVADFDEQRRCDDLLDELADQLPELAQGASRLVARGGGVLDEEMSSYVVAVVHRLTHWYDALGHSSSGGDEFRAMLTGQVAQALGTDLVRHLADRELAGLSSPDHPGIGWVSNAELCAAVAAGLPDVAPHLDEEDEDAVVHLVAAVERAAAGGLDLFGVYV